MAVFIIGTLLGIIVLSLACILFQNHEDLQKEMFVRISWQLLFHTVN